MYSRNKGRILIPPIIIRNNIKHLSLSEKEILDGFFAGYYKANIMKHRGWTNIRGSHLMNHRIKSICKKLQVLTIQEAVLKGMEIGLFKFPYYY